MKFLVLVKMMFALWGSVKKPAGKQGFCWVRLQAGISAAAAPMSHCWLNRSNPFERRLFSIEGVVVKSQRSPMFRVKLGSIFHWSSPYMDQVARLKLTSPPAGNSPEELVGKPSRAVANDNPPEPPVVPGQGGEGQPVSAPLNPNVWKVLIWSRATQTYWPPNRKSCFPWIQSILPAALQSGLRRRELPRFPISLVNHGLVRVATMPLNWSTLNPRLFIFSIPIVLLAWLNTYGLRKAPALTSMTMLDRKVCTQPPPKSLA